MSDKFCFYHGTHIENLPFILKDEVIKRSIDVKDKHQVRKEWGGDKYIYGGIYFCDIDVMRKDLRLFGCYFILDRSIMNDNTMIFNSMWAGKPILKENQSNDHLHLIHKKILNDFSNFDFPDHFSIYLNPNDSNDIFTLKINIIYDYLKKQTDDTYILSHEILILNKIKLNNVDAIMLTNMYKPLSKINKMALKISNKIIKKYKMILHDITSEKNIVNGYFSNQCLD